MEVLQKINNKIKREFNSCYLGFKYALGGIHHRNDFKDIQTMVLTIGFNRSGSSLVGYFLTAHPNIVIADEIQHMNTEGRSYLGRAGMVHLSEMYKGVLSNLFYAILDVDRLRCRSKTSTTSLHDEAQQEIDKRSKYRRGRYVLVPNQSQGRFERLKVIGVKASKENTMALLMNNTLVSLNRKLKKKNIKLKFISTIRNPYDIVSCIRAVFKAARDESICHGFEVLCKNHEKLLKRIDPQDIFVHRHEDMCKDPRRQLARLCNFLEVPIPAGYIEDCASQVDQEPRKSRLDIDWSPQLKQTVALMIEKYDFFSGYDWET